MTIIFVNLEDKDCATGYYRKEGCEKCPIYKSCPFTPYA